MKTAKYTFSYFLVAALFVSTAHAQGAYSNEDEFASFPEDREHPGRVTPSQPPRRTSPPTRTASGSNGVQLVCTDCAPWQMERAAKESFAGNESFATVIDPMAEQVARYRIFRRSVYTACPSDGGTHDEVEEQPMCSHREVTAEQVGVQPDVARELSALFDRAAGNYDVSIPATVAGSAFDVINDPDARHRVATAARNNRDAWQTGFHYLALVPAVVGKIVNVRLVIRVQFADGTSMKLMINGIDGAGNLVFKTLLDGALDSEGHPILPALNSNGAGESVMHYHGNYDSRDAAEDMFNYLREYRALGNSRDTCDSSTSCYIIPREDNQGNIHFSLACYGSRC